MPRLQPLVIAALASLSLTGCLYTWHDPFESADPKSLNSRDKVTLVLTDETEVVLLETSVGDEYIRGLDPSRDLAQRAIPFYSIQPPLQHSSRRTLHITLNRYHLTPGGSGKK